jgi:hypothetical protein
MSQLQKALGGLMLTNPELYTKLQGSVRGNGAPARETNQLEVGRRPAGLRTWALLPAQLGPRPVPPWWRSGVWEAGPGQARPAGARCPPALPALMAAAAGWCRWGATPPGPP